VENIIDPSKFYLLIQNQSEFDFFNIFWRSLIELNFLVPDRLVVNPVRLLGKNFIIVCLSHLIVEDCRRKWEILTNRFRTHIIISGWQALKIEPNKLP